MTATPETGLSSDLVALTRETIDARALLDRVRTPADGAVASFDGVVRNHSRGRSTLYLEYQAYEPMALRKLEEVARAARASFAIDRLAIVHRLGRLEIGESSVFIAVSAAHRAAALDACRFAIDTLKRTVPIWKKEFFADGAVWADGELPPPPPETPGREPAS